MYYRLPDNTNTNDREIYVDTWMALAQPIIDHTGLKIYGFDPTVSFVRSTGEIIQLPVWFVQMINKAIKEGF